MARPRALTTSGGGTGMVPGSKSVTVGAYSERHLGRGERKLFCPFRDFEELGETTHCDEDGGFGIKSRCSGQKREFFSVSRSPRANSRKSKFANGCHASQAPRIERNATVYSSTRSLVSLSRAVYFQRVRRWWRATPTIGCVGPLACRACGDERLPQQAFSSTNTESGTLRIQASSSDQTQSKSYFYRIYQISSHWCCDLRGVANPDEDADRNYRPSPCRSRGWPDRYTIPTNGTARGLCDHACDSGENAIEDRIAGAVLKKKKEERADVGRSVVPLRTVGRMVAVDFDFLILLQKQREKWPKYLHISTPCPMVPLKREFGTTTSQSTFPTSESHNPSNKVEILFDLMSHTKSGDSGTGDHSEDGIQSFVVQHKCGQRCIQMGLEKLGETEEEED
ncbi:hypothetical protein B0H14DRAFT_2590897 [Mycena olivaceomarginata]|nr:hypothetical protein B0H14DRAFT_2590897 [Mycena olivaceomarginata]